MVKLENSDDGQGQSMGGGPIARRHSQHPSNEGLDALAAVALAQDSHTFSAQTARRNSETISATSTSSFGGENRGVQSARGVNSVVNVPVQPQLNVNQNFRPSIKLDDNRQSMTCHQQINPNPQVRLILTSL